MSVARQRRTVAWMVALFFIVATSGLSPVGAAEAGQTGSGLTKIRLSEVVRSVFYVPNTSP